MSTSFASLGNIYNFDDQYNENVYHNAKELLKLYSKVSWRLTSSVMEMEADAYLRTGSRLYDVVDILVDIDTRINKERIESRLQSIEDSKSILELVDCALYLLKNYPNDGAYYYDILNMSYLVFVKYSESEILEILNVSRSTLYRDKKKATMLLGIILWGFVVPDIRNVLKNNDMLYMLT